MYLHVTKLKCTWAGQSSVAVTKLSDVSRSAWLAFVRLNCERSFTSKINQDVAGEPRKARTMGASNTAKKARTVFAASR
jgi:hypothetical protein